MSELLVILIGTILVNNFVLVRFLGLCPFMGVSRNLEAAAGMSLATAFVLTLSSATAYLLYQYVLVPLELDENAPIRLELKTLVPQSSPSKAAWRRWKWASADLVGTLLKAITLTGLLFAGSTNNMYLVFGFSIKSICVCLKQYIYVGNGRNSVAHQVG